MTVRLLFELQQDDNSKRTISGHVTVGNKDSPVQPTSLFANGN